MKVARRKDLSQTIKFGKFTIDGDITPEQLKEYSDAYPGIAELFEIIDIAPAVAKAVVSSSK